MEVLSQKKIMRNIMKHAAQTLCAVSQALVDFTDFQIYQELIKGCEDNSFYKSCASEMLRQIMEEGCTTRSKVLNYLGERFRVKMNLPEWYTNEECAIILIE